MRKTNKFDKSAPTLAHSAYDQLRADLLACRMPPGQDIVIKELSMRLGTNPIAIREALSKLSAEGLVTAEAQKGFRVAPISPADLRDLTVARVEIECICLRLAIETGGLEWETGIVAALHRMSRTPMRVADDPRRTSDEWVKNHLLFHEALTGDCGSTLLRDIRAALYAKSERYRRLSVPLAVVERDLDAEHKALATAALDRDSVAAIQQMSKHLRMTADILSENTGAFDTGLAGTTTAG